LTTPIGPPVAGLPIRTSSNQAVRRLDERSGRFPSTGSVRVLLELCRS
jgi:hypothetical protein